MASEASVHNVPARAQQRRRRFRSPETIALCALLGVVAVYWAVCGLLIHRSFHSNGWDLGLINQVLWNTAHGRLFEYSFRDISFAGDHWQPFLLLLVPLKRLLTGPEPLLMVQAIVLAAAAIPLYASVRIVGKQYAVGLAGAYLFSLGVARAVSFDFHIDAFAPLLAFTALLGLTRNQPIVFVVAALTILALKEDGPLLTLALCWIAWFAFGKRRSAASVGAAAVFYGIVVTAVVIPHFRGADLNPFAERYGYLGDSPVEVVWGSITHPNLVISQLTRNETIEALVIVLASCALIPLLAPRLLPPLAVVTLLPLLSKETAQGSLDLHYLLVPSTVALLIAAVAIRERAWEKVGTPASQRWAGGWFADRSGRFVPLLLVSVSALLWLLKSPLPPSFAADLERFNVDHHAAVARDFLRDIPADAIVSAQSPFVPHISERQDIYQFPRVLDAEVILLDDYGPIPLDDLAAGYSDCLAALPRLGFDEMRREDGISLWRKVNPPESVPDIPVACSGQNPHP